MCGVQVLVLWILIMTDMMIFMFVFLGKTFCTVQKIFYSSISMISLSKKKQTAYGLADTGYSTQAVFFDYDKDGDLDMYLANYLLTAGNANNIFPRDRSGHSPANDKLYRNDGDSSHAGHPVFTDVINTGRY